MGGEIHCVFSDNSLNNLKPTSITNLFWHNKNNILQFIKIVLYLYSNLLSECKNKKLMVR